MKREKQKILLVTKDIPYPPHTGGKVRILNLLKRISQQYEVSLLCMSNIQSIKYSKNLKPFCKNIFIVPIVTDRHNLQKMFLLFKPREWHRLLERIMKFFQGVPYGNICFYHPDFRNRLKKILLDKHYDIIQFEFIVTGQYFTDIKDLIQDTKTILVQHGIISDELKRMVKYSPWFKRILYRIESFLSSTYEKKILPQYDHVISMSELDKKKMINWGLQEERITVIKSGVDIDYYKENEILRSDNNIIFLGAMKYFPNREGLIWFLDNVFPIIRNIVQDATLVVIGETDPNIVKLYNNSHIVFLGVLEDLKPVMGKGTIFIAPIRVGTGTRLKIVTAMAFGMPVVCTSVGIEGIEVRATDGAIIADTEKDFSEAVINLLQDKNKRYILGADARRFVEREYSWDTISNDLFALYESLLNK